MRKFSVVIPLYNKEGTIRQTIESVLNQTFENFEFIIVDDGSTDNSVAIVNSFNDKRIKLFTKKNNGVSSARNIGIVNSTTDFIAFLDADDWWANDFLKEINSLIEKFPLAFIYASNYVQIFKDRIVKLKNFPDINEGYFDIKKHLTALHSSSVVVKKEVFNEVGKFDEKLVHGEDTDMWIRIGLNHDACYISKTLSYFNNADNPLNRSVLKMPKYNQHLVSKIDAYFINGNNEWNSILLQRKVNYLIKYYSYYPFSIEVKKSILTLPKDMVQNKDMKILFYPSFIIYLRKLFVVVPISMLIKIKHTLLKHL